MDLFGGAKNTKKSKKTKKTSDAKKTTKTTKSAKTSDAKKTTKSAKSAKTSDAKKTKKSSTTTRSNSKMKGGNFLGAVGDLVAPTGWGPFATAAGLLALDRADAALRRGTKEKKMKGGRECPTTLHVSTTQITPVQFNFYNIYEFSKNKGNNYKKWTENYFDKTLEFEYEDTMTIYFINNDDNTISLKIEGIFFNKNENKTQQFSHCLENPRFKNLTEALKYAKDENRQKNLGKLLVKEYARTRNPPITLRNGFFTLRNYGT